nr:hypothetical protein CFP56_28563 [Quercus suber]
MADYFNFGSRRRGTSVTQERLNAPLPPGPSGRSRPSYMGSLENMRMPSNIQIRRLPSYAPEISSSRPTSAQNARTPLPEDHDDFDNSGRRRSMSAPYRFEEGGHAAPAADLSRQRTIDSQMQTITEGVASNRRQPTMHPGFLEPQETPQPVSPAGHSDEGEEFPRFDGTGLATPGAATVMHSAGNAAQRNRGVGRSRGNTATSRDSGSRRGPDDGNYDSDVVDFLDLIDPEVRTIGTLTNLQNSLFVPDLGSLINRRPTYDLSSRRPTTSDSKGLRARAGTRTGHRPLTTRLSTIPQDNKGRESGDIELQTPHRTHSVSSQLSDSRFAVLPHGVSLDGWTDEEVAELNDHVRHLLHSRKEGFKRGWKGFRQYISKPLGLFVFIYATLVTLFGAAWVFGLIGWIYVANRQDYIINVIDNVLVALFALMGDGLAPFRAVDTYHMCFIAHYHHLTWRLRKEKQLPGLVDHNDLPGRQMDLGELEDAVDKEETAEFSVLSVRQQKRLQYHQAKFNKAHTFYRPHETPTHHAFPLRLLVAVVVLLDCHSLFQIALGTCTWSIDYRVRPEALTATILACSITCNIMGGVIISIGDHRTRKKDVLERVFRQNITEQALRDVQKRHADRELAVTVDLDMLAETPQDGSAPPKKPEKLMDPRRSMDVRRSMDARRSMEARRSLDVDRVLADHRSAKKKEA